jgi:hypothetical protein
MCCPAPGDERHCRSGQPPVRRPGVQAFFDHADRRSHPGDGRIHLAGQARRNQPGGRLRGAAADAVQRSHRQRPELVAGLLRNAGEHCRRLQTAQCPARADRRLANQPNPWADTTRRVWTLFLKLALVAIVVQSFFFFMSSEKLLLRQDFTFEPRSSDEVQSGEFTLAGKQRKLAVRQSTSLDNNWIGLDLLLVNKTTGQPGRRRANWPITGATTTAGGPKAAATTRWFSSISRPAPIT